MHAVKHDLLPFSFFLKRHEGLMNRRTQLRRCVARELKSSSLPALRIPLLDGIFETAGCANYRDGSVAHAVDLSEAARFIVGRHQEYVGACLDHVREAIVVSDLDAEAVREPFVQSSEHGFVMDVAGSEHKQYHLFSEKLRQRSFHQIKTFLRGKARDYSNYRPIGFLFRNAVLIQQCKLAFLFAA